MSRIPVLFSILCVLSVVFFTSCDPPPPRQHEIVSDGKPIVGVIAGKSTPYWDSMEFGAGNSAVMNELHLLWQENSDTDDFDQQAAAIRSFIARRVQGIIVTTQNELMLRDILQRATDQGIHVLLADSPPLKHTENLTQPLSIVATDQNHAGQLAADEMARLLGEEGRVAIIRYSPLSWKTENREKGFLSQIENYPEIEVVGQNLYAGTESRFAREKLMNFLRLRIWNGKLNLDGIFISEESTACEMLLLLEQAELDINPHFVAFGTDPQLVTGMATYLVDALFAEQPVRMGQLAVDAMAEMLRGETIAPFCDSGVHCITIENLMSPYSQALLYPTAEDSPNILLNKDTDSETGSE